MGYLTTTTSAPGEMTRNDVAVFGVGAVKHPITDLPIERGHGCLGVHDQAVKVHVPLIAAEQGVDKARRVLAELAALDEKRKIEIHQGVIAAGGTR
jgi:hypothetical protein